MNVTALANRIAKEAGTELDQMPVDKLQMIADAITFAQGEFFAEAPERLKRTQLSFRGDAPRVVPLYCVDNSKDVQVSDVDSTEPFTAADRGKTVHVGGDIAPNECVSNGELLRPFTGTTGNTTATIYGDAVAITDVYIERIVTNPRDIRSGRTLGQDERKSPDYWSRRHNTHVETGEPIQFSIDHTGAAGGSADIFVFRVWPAPDSVRLYTMDAHVLPLPVEVADIGLGPPKALLVPSPYHHTILYPLVRWHALTLGLLSEKLEKKIEAGRESAMARIMAIPAVSAPPNRTVHTRPGF